MWEESWNIMLGDINRGFSRTHSCGVFRPTVQSSAIQTPLFSYSPMWFLFNSVPTKLLGTRSSTVLKGLSYKSEGPGFEIQWSEWLLSMYLILPVTLGRGVYSASNRRKYKTNFMALSPQANYTDWATSTCRRNLVPTFVDRGVSRGQRGGSSTVVNLSFLDRSHYFSFK
jgi:hypothetical protein